MLIRSGPETGSEYMKTLCLIIVLLLRVTLPAQAPNDCSSAKNCPSTSVTDIYGGVTAAHKDAEATGVMHLRKVGSRWIWYTALGNPFYLLAVDNARLGADLGQDINGHGNQYYVDKKYALGQGPNDGFRN